MNAESKSYNYHSTFPYRLRTIMADSKTTHKAIAEICGVKSQSVSMWVNGQTRPDILSLVKIAEHFNVSTDYLLGLTDYKTTDKATVEMCKALGLSEDAVRLLLGDAETPYAECVARNYRKQCGVEIKKSDLELLSNNFAITFNRLVDEHFEEYAYKNEHLDESFVPTPLLSLLQDFYVAVDSKEFMMLCDQTYVGFEEGALITAETESGYTTSISFSPKEAFVTSAINSIVARLNKIKTENK